MKFRSRHHAHSLSKRVWECKACGVWHYAKPTQCVKSNCYSQDFFYFMSEIEAKYHAELKLLSVCGNITNIEVQPVFPLHVNGVRLCKYVADFAYRKKGIRIVEDIKPKGWTKKLDPLSWHKIQHASAEYGIEIKIVERS